MNIVSVAVIVFLSSFASAGEMKFPDLKPLDAELNAFVSAVLQASSSNDSKAVLALAHPGLSACPGWEEGMQDKVSRIANALYGTVDENAEREYFEVGQAKFIQEAKASGQTWLVKPERQVQLRAGSRVSAILVTKTEGEWRFVWACI